MSQPQFKVTLRHLTADAAQANPNEASRELGLIDEASLLVLLENFIRTDSQDSDSGILITAGTGRFSIQSGRGRLFFYDTRDLTRSYVELTPAGIVQQLVGSRPAPTVDEIIALPAAKSPHRLIALAILAAGLALNGYTLYSVFYIDSVNAQPSLMLLTQSAEITSTRQALAGSFSTGRNPGDRGIVVNPDGSVRFMEFGPKGNRYETSDTYRLGRKEKTLCLATADNGVIEVMNPTSLRYYGDIYRRAD